VVRTLDEIESSLLVLNVIWELEGLRVVEGGELVAVVEEDGVNVEGGVLDEGGVDVADTLAGVKLAAALLGDEEEPGSLDVPNNAPELLKSVF